MTNNEKRLIANSHLIKQIIQPMYLTDAIIDVELKEIWNDGILQHDVMSHVFIKFKLNKYTEMPRILKTQCIECDDFILSPVSYIIFQGDGKEPIIRIVCDFKLKNNLKILK